MNKPLKITRIGNSAGIILPKALLAHLGAKVGDSLAVVRTSRGIEIAIASEETVSVEDELAAAREVIERRHQAMMALANEIVDQDRAILAALDKE